MKKSLPLLIISLIFLSTPMFSYELVDLFEIQHKQENRLGPLITRVGAIWQGMNLKFQADSAKTLKQNEFFTGFQFLMANFYGEKSYTTDGKYIIKTDVETFVYAFELSYGVFDWFTVGLEYEIKHHHPGIMDPYIQSFHRTFRTPNGGREYAEDDTIDFYVYDRTTGKNVMNIQSAVAGINDIVLKTKFKLFYNQTGTFGAGLVLALKFPTGEPSNMTGTGSFDYGAGLLIDLAPFNWCIFYINVFYIINGDFKGPNNFTVDLDNQLQIFVNIEFLISDVTSLILAVNTFNSAFSSITLENWDGDRIPQRIAGRGYQIFLGFKYKISAQMTFQFFIMEEMEPWTTSDISFSFAVYFKL